MDKTHTLLGCKLVSDGGDMGDATDTATSGELRSINLRVRLNSSFIKLAWLPV